MTAATEPEIPGKANAYNDVALITFPGARARAVDIDVTVHSIAQDRCRHTIYSGRTDGPPQTDADMRQRIQKALTVFAKEKIRGQGTPPPSAPPFIPFVLSAGGLLLDDAHHALDSWKKAVPEGAHSRFLRLASAALTIGREARPGKPASVRYSKE